MTQAAILCIDDEPMVAQALRGLLEQHPNDFDLIEFAESGDEALEVIDELIAEGVEIKVVIADYIMPNMRGDELLTHIHQRSPRTKKIMLTGQSDIGGVKRAINEAELYRFIEKPWHNEDLLLTLRSALQEYNHETELERQNTLLRELNEQLRRLNEELETKVAARTRELEEKNQALARLAVTDGLTGLFNRVKLDTELEQEFARTRRYATPFSVLLLDVDHFKRINDTHGHQAGDRVLIALAAILRQCARATDKVGRWGGEEFLLICPQTELAGARRLAEHQRTTIAAHAFPGIGHCGASFGVTQYQDGDTVSTLIARADAALYRAKAGGRNRVEVAEPPNI